MVHGGKARMLARAHTWGLADGGPGVALNVRYDGVWIASGAG